MNTVVYYIMLAAVIVVFFIAKNKKKIQDGNFNQEDNKICSYCGEQIVYKYQWWQIFVAIFFFPVGLIYLTLGKYPKCAQCGRVPLAYNSVANNKADMSGTGENNDAALAFADNDSESGQSAQPSAPKPNKPENPLIKKIKDIIGKMSLRTRCIIVAAVIVFIAVAVPSARAISKYNRANALYNTAVVYQSKNEYLDAYNCLERALEIKPNMEKALTLIEEVGDQLVEQYISEAKNRMDEGNYEYAYNTVKRALVYDSTNEEAVELKKQINDLLADQYIAESQKFIDAGDYISAYEKLEEGLSISSDNTRMQSALNDIEQPYQEAVAAKKAAEEAAAAAERAAQEQAEAEAKAQQEAEEKAAQEAAAKAQQEAAAKAAQSAQSAANAKTNYINSAPDVTAAVLLRAPSDYTNKKICITGWVTSQVTLDRGTLQSALEYFGLADTQNLEEVIINDGTGDVAVMYDSSSSGIRLLEGDWVSAYGEFEGLTELTSTNIYGTESTYKVPKLNAKYFN
ncbi:MAG: hypothetical protein LUF26_08595 [Firmicutes bacterium]|nr:hypothetical protein [Bacillota bacterium]